MKPSSHDRRMSNRNNGLALALSAILVAQPVVAQTEPAVQPAVVEYAPVGPWTVDYAEDSCALFRKFNDDERELWIEFRQIAPDSMARVLIGGSHLVLTEAEPHVTIYPGREAFDHWAKTFTSEDGSVRAIITSLYLHLLQSGEPSVQGDADEVAPDPLPEIAGIQIARAFDQTVAIHTGEMDTPVQALETCMTDLVRTWGIDPEELERAVTPPVPEFEKQWRARVRNYYPRTGLHRSRNTRFPVVLLVGPDGRVARCRSPNALGDEDFEAVACAALTRFARFNPAVDGEGEPTYGFWSTFMVYVTT